MALGGRFGMVRIVLVAVSRIVGISFIIEGHFCGGSAEAVVAPGGKQVPLGLRPFGMTSLINRCMERNQ